MEELWPNALDFLPERWLGPDRPSNYLNIVFNAGPRLCLGKPLAYLEIKLILCMLLTRFTFHAEGPLPKDSDYVNTLVLPMLDGIRLRPVERKVLSVSPGTTATPTKK